MIGTTSANGMGQTLILPSDIDVSWAGPCPPWINGDVCLGGEDGRVLFLPDNPNRKPDGNRFISNGDAVNGVAFLDNNRMAISSPGEVAFMTFSQGQKPMRSVFPGGAHGVISTKSGNFVAPLGISGVLIHKPTTQLEQPVAIHKGEHPVNFYKATSLCKDETETLAFAAREDGVFATVLPDAAHKPLDDVHWFRFHDFDAIDVCGLGSRSVAALGVNGTLVLFRDILSKDETPLTLSFPDVAGTAYSVLKVDEHVVVLTSQSLYIFKDLARRFLVGNAVDGEPTFVLSIPVEAVDMHQYRGSKILIVLPEKVIMLDVGLLLQPSLREAFVPRQSNGLWQHGRERTRTVQYDLVEAGA